MSAMIPFEVPVRAIEAFESLTGLRITLYDLVGSISVFLPPDRSEHTNPFCEAVKAAGYVPVCVEVDWTNLVARLSEEPVDLIKLCPAGLVESVVPVLLEKRLAWVLFAGVRRPGKDLIAEAIGETLARKSIRWPASGPRPIGEAQAQVCLEALRQLAARLMAWWEHWGRDLSRRKDVHMGEGTDPATRRFVIRSFVLRRYQERITLADLAERLGLSESRAAHVVKETCGVRFHDLLKQTRLEVASALLRRSNLTLQAIAGRTGFSDATHLIRRFRGWRGITPGRYRLQHRRALREGS